MPFVTEIDIRSNVVFTDEGHILEVEQYVDDEHAGCLIEDATGLYYMFGSDKIKYHKFTEEQMELIENAFDYN